MPSRFLILALAVQLVATPCYGHGGFHEEIQRCDFQIAADPDNAQLWFRRAKIECLHGNWMRSLIDLEKAERLAPGKHPVNLVRGQAWMIGEKWTQARKALDAFIESQPELAEGYATRARLMRMLEDEDSAVADFRKALAKTKNPEPDLFIELANALVAAGHSEAALPQLDAGMKKLGMIPSLASKALELEMAVKSYDSALLRVADMQDSAPRPEPWMAKRAEILAQAGRIEEARAAWIALRDHLLALPEHERGSHALSLLLEHAFTALKSLHRAPISSLTQSINLRR